jgi:hypothetical protein
MRFILLLILTLSLFGCTKNEKRKKQGTYWVEIVGTTNDGIEKKFTSDGRLVSETPYKNSLPHGLKKDYHQNGQVFTETPCDSGIVNGVVKEYFQSGKLYKETPTKKGKVDGIKKMYYENGSLKSEAIYKDGKPLQGLKEYDRNGKLIPTPKIQIIGRDKTVLDGSYLIELSLSSDIRKANYYVIYFDNNTEQRIKLTSEKGKGYYTEFIPRGGVVMKQLVFEAVFYTKFGNTCVVRANYAMAVSNKN